MRWLIEPIASPLFPRFVDADTIEEALRIWAAPIDSDRLPKRVQVWNFSGLVPREFEVQNTPQLVEVVS